MKIWESKLFFIIIFLNSILFQGEKTLSIYETFTYDDSDLLNINNSILESFSLIFILALGDHNFILCLLFSSKLPNIILIIVAFQLYY